MGYLFNRDIKGTLSNESPEYRVQSTDLYRYTIQIPQHIDYIICTLYSELCTLFFLMCSLKRLTSHHTGINQ